MAKFADKLFFFTLILTASCSSPSVIRILSVPEDAQVSVVDSNGTATLIGKTPLTSNENDVYRSNNRYSQLKISKDNFQAQEVVLMKSTNGSETTINVQLKRDETNQNIGEQASTQEKIASGVARANGLIQSKQYIEAENIMLNFVEQYPSISVGYDYLGNLNYIQKKFQKALKYYNKALTLNPQNTERRMIVEKIQNIVKSSAGDAQ
jgi:tetratricopeptide (TPR) repeat protein